MKKNNFPKSWGCIMNSFKENQRGIQKVTTKIIGGIELPSFSPTLNIAVTVLYKNTCMLVVHFII